MTGSWDDLPIRPDHAEMLAAHAILPEVAQVAGIRSIESFDELPEGSPSWWARLLPGLLYRWRLGDRVEYQIATDDRSDESRPKYAFRDDTEILLNEARPGDGPVLIVEGTKQQFAAASYAPEGYAVYGVAGCWNWTKVDLSFLSDRNVIVIFDGDLTRKRSVYDAAQMLAETLNIVSVTSVSFAVLPTTGSDGLDDLLGRAPHEKRAGMLSRIVSSAGPLPKKRPKAMTVLNEYIDPAAGGLQVVKLATAVFDRAPLALTQERKIAVYRDGAYRIDGSALFGIVGHLLGEQYRPSHRGAVEEFIVGRLSEAGLLLPVHSEVTLLNVRNGMLDLVTGTLKPHDPVYMSMIQFPVEWQADAPAPVYTAWLEDMIGDQAEDIEEVASTMLDPSRTPPKAMFLYGPSRSGKSTFLRLLAAVAGPENTAAVTLHQLSTNRFAAANLYGKALNAAADLSAAHVDDLSMFKMLTGEDLVQADRKYGGQFAFTNRALFAFSANELPTVGESSRAYVERIKPFRFGRSFAGREDPEIERAMMAELPGILSRWVTAGQRRMSRGGYLPTDDRVRAEFEQASDRVRQWVAEETRVVALSPDGREIVPGMVVGSESATAPRSLAQAFNRWAERNNGSKIGERKIISRLTSIDGVYEVRISPGKGRGLNIVDSGRSGASGTFEAPLPCTPEDASHHHTDDQGIIGVQVHGKGASKVPLRPQQPTGGSVAIDLETADAGLLWRHGPGFVRLCGYTEGDEIKIDTDADALARRIASADRVIGHHVLGFDLLALARYHGLDLWALVSRGAVIDTKLAAFLAHPPYAKMNAGQIEKFYSLDSVGAKLLGETKHGDLKALAKKHGGYDKIPIDDPEYVEYLRGDVSITRQLAEKIPLDDYGRREHKVAGIAAQISLNGFRVDLPLLAERREGVIRRRAEKIAMLQEKYGLPVYTKDGKTRAKAPQNTEQGRTAIKKAFEDLGAKHMPKTESGAWATGREAMDRMIEYYGPRPGGPEIVELAEIVKSLNGERVIYETITDNLAGDRVHPTIDLRQASGRWSLTKPGLTVMGKRNGRYVEREVFLPEPGHVVVTADLAQVDARAVAVLSQDPAYMDLFEPGKDIHAETALQIFGDASMRDRAKEISHGWNYGRGPRAIAAAYNLPEELTYRFDEGMRERFPGVVEWQNAVREEAESGRLLDNGFGRRMRPDPDRAFTQGPALMGQGCARDLMMEGLLRLADAHPEILPMLRAQVHDEIVLSVPEGIAEDVERAVVDALSFEWAPAGAQRPIRIMADTGRRGVSWGDCYRKEAP